MGTNKVSVTGVALTAASIVFAIAMQNQIGIWVRAVVPKPTSSSFNVLLNANATANLTVGWFIVN